MKTILSFLLVALCGVASAEWKLNPYTQRQDYYEGTAALILSTGTFQGQINALNVATATLTVSLSAETAARISGDSALSVSTSSLKSTLDSVILSTAPLKDYANWNTAYSWGDHAGLYLVAPATFTYVASETDPIVGAVTGIVKADGAGNISAAVADTDYQSPLTAGTDYLAPDGDGSNLSGVIPSTATGYYGIYVASANYAANGGTGGGVVQSTAIIDGSPIGSIIQHSTTTPPSGYLYCDGSYVSTTTYANLFAVTGHRYSTYTVTGSPAVFQLPDFRGMFARGAYGNLNSRDPNGNRVVGSTQTDTMQGHRHSFQALSAAGGTTLWNYSAMARTAGTYDTNNGGVVLITDPVTDGTNGTPRTSVETRPENIAVAFHIKYMHTAAVTISSSAIINSQNNTWTGKQTYTDSVTVVSSATLPGGSGIRFTSPISASTAAVNFAISKAVGVNYICENSTVTLNVQQGSLAEIFFQGGVIRSTAGNLWSIFMVDGSPVTTASYGLGVYYMGTASGGITFSTRYLTGPLSAGNHTFCFIVNGDGSGTLTSPSGGFNQFSVREIR